MTDLAKLTDRVKTITFDCYGTLVDWRGGITAALDPVLGDRVPAGPTALIDLYVETEAAVEAEKYRRYREVLSLTEQRLCERLGVAVAGDSSVLVDSIGNWPLHADTNEALQRLASRYKLGVLSNIDRDLFAQTARNFDVEFDFLISAEDVRSYKPGLGHFERMLAGHGPAESVLHVAQSLFHDGGPAGKLGIAFVWINRYKHENDTDVATDAEFGSLLEMADALGV